MITIFKNTFRVFKHNKEFIMSVAIQPVLLFLLMSVLLPYTKEHSVGVCNLSQNPGASYIVEALENLDGVRVETVKEKDLQDKLMNSNIELAVVISDQPGADVPVAQVISVGDSEIRTAVELVVSETNLTQPSDENIVTVNEVKKKGLNISTTLAFMIFKTLTAAGLLGSLIAEERRNKIRDRIFLSGISRGAYLGGMSLLYLLCMMLGTTLFFGIGQIFNFDFGMRYPVGYLLMMYLADFISVSLFVCVSSVAKNDEAIWMFGSFCIMPMSLLAGILFPFEFMPKAMQTIGACFPPRWIARGIEIMQKNGSLLEALPYMGLCLLFGIILFTVGVLKTPKTNVQ